MSDILIQAFQPALVESTSEEISALTEGLHINAAQGNTVLKLLSQK